MQRDDVMEMARDAGFSGWEQNEIKSPYAESEDLSDLLEAFAKLVAAKAWSQGYQQGVEDERTSEDNIGIAGFWMKVQPARENPYAIRARGES